MGPLPEVLATTVVRGTGPGQRHGGIYLVDLASGKTLHRVDWDQPNIDWTGRGGARGLRGIAFHQEQVFVAAHDRMLVLDRDLGLCDEIGGSFLGHCHEVAIRGAELLVTSTDFDSVLTLDLVSRRFRTGFVIRRTGEESMEYGFYDARGPGPDRGDTIHLNNVVHVDGRTLVSGRDLPLLLEVEGEALRMVSRLPLGTHNARPWGDGVLFNDSDEGGLTLQRMSLYGESAWSVLAPRYPDEELEPGVDAALATQGFTRGLCELDREGRLVAFGSSPATITVQVVGEPGPVRTVTLQTDVREAIHGLEVWPFG